MYDKQVIRRRRAVLVILVVLSIVLLTGYFGEGSGGFFHGIQRAAQAVVSPIESGASRAFQPVRDLVNSIGNVFTANSENGRLKAELQSTREQLAANQTRARDDAQFRGLLGLPKSSGYPQDTKPVTARVIAKSENEWYSTVEIDVGSTDGIKQNMPVVTGGGLLGRVTLVNPLTSRVTLITDASSAVSAEVVPGGAQGVVQPAVGNPNDMRLEFLQNAKAVHQGDTVITSGFISSKLESLFPRGIPIGKVNRVDNNEVTLYQLVHIQPYANFQTSNYVQVLTAKPPIPQSQVQQNAPAGGP
ncbi:MAG: rod shape-determining protein MreC [Actinobacteria bacterium]|nr:rod shape-determining protein MreC [Actinomycetota bacterium]